VGIKSAVEACAIANTLKNTTAVVLEVQPQHDAPYTELAGIKEMFQIEYRGPQREMWCSDRANGSPVPRMCRFRGPGRMPELWKAWSVLDNQTGLATIHIGSLEHKKATGKTRLIQVEGGNNIRDERVARKELPKNINRRLIFSSLGLAHPKP
jgi:hypothetical protein